MTKPSWQDFATHDESAYPELWDGVVGAWAPCLGPTGSRLHDHSRRSNWGTLTNMDNATDWVVDGGQYALDFDGSNDQVNTNITTQFADFTVWCWFRVPSDTGTYRRLIDKNFTSGFWLGRNSAAAGQWGGGILEANPLYGTFVSLTTSVVSFLAMSRQGTVKTVVGGALGGRSIFATGSVSSAALDTTRILLGGRNPEAVIGEQFFGLMYEAAVCNRGYSGSELSAIHSLGPGGMYQRRRRSRIYIPQAGFQAAWARRQSQIIGGGL